MRFESLPKRRRTLSRDDVARAIETAIEGFVGAGISFDPLELRLEWIDGPGPRTVWQAAGEPSGWSLAQRAFYVGPEESANQVLMERSHSPRALCQAAVRFYAIVERPPDFARQRDLERIAEILGADQPLPGHFPIVEYVAEIVARELPANVDDPPGYVLAAARELERRGYSRLWGEAYRMAQ